MNIRRASKNDRPHWARMRNTLWPDSIDVHTVEIENYFSNKSNDVQECFLIDEGEVPVGFIELNIRNYAEGSTSSQIPYVEGWFVDKSHRGRGFGKALMSRAETWATESGYSELASDAEIKNTASIAAHTKLGFQEVDRVVCFLKKLK